MNAEESSSAGDQPEVVDIKSKETESSVSPAAEPKKAVTPLSEKPKKRGRWWKWTLGVVAVLAVAAGASYYFKLYQPLLDRYNASAVTIKVKEGDTFVIQGAKVVIGSQTVTTDTNGKAAFSNIVAGTYAATITKDGYVTGNQNITLHRGDNDPVYISLTKVAAKTYTVKGFVQDYVSGTPVVNVKVVLGAKTVQTDPSGAYSFDKVEAGDSTLAFSKDGYISLQVPVKVVDADVVTAKVPLVPSGQIVFVSNRDGKRALYASNYDGTGQKQFVAPQNGGEDFSPSFAPGGDRLAFSSTRDKVKSTYGGDLVKAYIINKDGTGLKKVSDDLATQFVPVWSPNGKFAFYSGYTSTKLDQASNQVYDVVKASLINIGEPAYGLVFSPDSTKVAYYVNGTEDRTTTTTQSDGSTLTTTTKAYLSILKTLDLVSGERKILAKRENGVSSIAFNAASSAVSYESVTDSVRHRYEVVIASGTEKEIALTDLVARRYVTSPGGALKAFIEERDGKTDIFTVDRDGKNEKRLTTIGTVFTGQELTWDQSDRYLVFAIQKQGESGLYVVSTNGGEAKKITDYYNDGQRYDTY